MNAGGQYSLDPLDLAHASTVERAAEALRQALFAGELAPGTPLREVALADSLGIGRSTVREAMALLAAEGLVTRIPNRGVLVTTHDSDQVKDVMHARLVLEAAGVRAWQEASTADRQGLREAFDSYARLVDGGAPVRAVSEAHLHFHISLVALTGSSRLVAVAQSLAAEIRLALAHVDRVRKDVFEQLESHRRLLALLESGDGDATISELRAHLRAGESSLLQALEQLA
ncbi:MAG: GntR family transcriptional regulator [Actinomycetota bacterium]|nr:GntR family transcriptional regulator [Actinomycetota bacterium]